MLCVQLKSPIHQMLLSCSGSSFKNQYRKDIIRHSRVPLFIGQTSSIPLGLLSSRLSLLVNMLLKLVFSLKGCLAPLKVPNGNKDQPPKVGLQVDVRSILVLTRFKEGLSSKSIATQPRKTLKHKSAIGTCEASAAESEIKLDDVPRSAPSSQNVQKITKRHIMYSKVLSGW